MEKDIIIEKKIKQVDRKYWSCFNSFGIIVRFLLFIATVFLCFVINSVSQIKWALFFLLGLNVYLVIVSHKQLLSLIISFFLLWFNYSIFFANYILKIESMFTKWAYSDDVAISGFKVVLLFMGALCLFIKDDKLSYADNSFNYQNKKMTCLFASPKPGNLFIGYVYIIVLLLIFILGFDVPTEEGARGSGSTYYEYSVVLFIVGFYFFGWNKSYKILSSCLVLLYSLTEMKYGGRITALQLLLVLFLFYYDGKKIPWLRLVPVGILLFAAFLLVGNMRGGVTFSFENLRQSLGDFYDSFGMLDTAYSAYYTSLTFIKVGDFIGVEQRFVMFIKFCLSMFLGAGVISDSNLSNFTHQYYIHYYGGVLPFFGQFYLGSVGVVLFAYIVAFYMNKIRNIYIQKGATKCVLLYITISTPRWYLYSPSNLIRGAFLLLIVYYCTLVALRTTTKSG